MDAELFGSGNLDAIYQQVKSAINNNTKQTALTAAQSRQGQKASIANSANAKHVLFSSQPSQRLTQYDSSTFIPNTATAIVKGLKTQQENQENWDKVMSQINSLNQAADEIYGQLGGNK